MWCWPMKCYLYYILAFFKILEYALYNEIAYDNRAFCYKYLHSMLFRVVSMFCLMCISFLRKSPDHSKETLLIIHVSIKSDEVVLGMTRTWYETDQLLHNDDMWNLILNMKLQAKEFYEKLQCWYIMKILAIPLAIFRLIWNTIERICSTEESC